MSTQQEDFWAGDFGREYTDRNSRPLDEWNAFYRDLYGHTKLEMNAEFLGELAREARILEVGCNTGMQLVGLQAAGFTNLYGIELQHYAVEKARDFVRGANILQGSGFDLPFKDGYFDVVCTNGVLIHIAPDDLPRIMGEMVRCSRPLHHGLRVLRPRNHPHQLPRQRGLPLENQLRAGVPRQLPGAAAGETAASTPTSTKPSAATRT